MCCKIQEGFAIQNLMLLCLKVQLAFRHIKKQDHLMVYSFYLTEYIHGPSSTHSPAVSCC